MSGVPYESANDPLRDMKPAERIRTAGGLIQAHQGKVHSLALIRRASIEEALETMKIEDLAEALGVTLRRLNRWRGRDIGR